MNFRKIFAGAALCLIVLDLVVPPVIVYRPIQIGGALSFPASHEGHLWRYGLGLETAVEWPRLTGELVVIGLVAGLLIFLAPSPRLAVDQPVRVKKPLALNRAQGLVIVGGLFVGFLYGLSFFNGSSDNYWLLILVWAVISALTFGGLLLTAGRSPPEQARQPVPQAALGNEGITAEVLAGRLNHPRRV